MIDRLTADPEATGSHAWYGWFDTRRFRRKWAETGLLGDDGGMLIAVRNAERLGFVTWRRQPTSVNSYCWNIGVAMLPEVRGLGYGTEAQRTLAEYLFAHTQANRVEAMTEVTNTSEQWALEKAGFVREGVLRGYHFRDGHWRDSVVYSMLREDLQDRGDAKGQIRNLEGIKNEGKRRDDAKGGKAIQRRGPSNRAPATARRES